MRSEPARRLQQVQSNRGTLSSRQLIAQNGGQSADSGNGIQPTRVRLDHRHHQQRSPLVQRHRGQRVEGFSNIRLCETASACQCSAVSFVMCRSGVGTTLRPKSQILCWLLSSSAMR